MDQLTNVIILMLHNPPDRDEAIPISNKKSVMFGVTIPFLVLSWLFVAFRLHTRLRVIREPGVDDVFVVLAAVFQLLLLISFFNSAEHGMGRHMIDVLWDLKPILIWIYISNATYHTTSACIKISLLLQYLRMFLQGRRRIVCIILLVVVICWSVVFSFMAWFPCFPVSGFWNRAGAKCYGYGFSTTGSAKATLLTFSATNMVLDIAIFAIPLTEYFRKDLGRKQVLAMTGLFTLGAVAVLMAILRLWSVFKHNASSVKSFDFTWWYPQVLIISSLEVSFAIMCASMPVFWPTVMISWGHIFVTNEVRVTSHERLGSGSRENFELERTNSVKSGDESTRILKSAHSEQMYAFDRYYQTGNMKGGGLGIMHVEVQPSTQK